jgi:glyoxylate/hydroxypyruvate reductase A
MSSKKFRLHIENMRAQLPVFQITPERFAIAASQHADAAKNIDVSFGLDGDIFDTAVRDADCVIGWRFPLADLKSGAPCLKWIHITGAGVEHLLPMDWLPPGVTLTNNRGVHAEKAGEYVAMAVLALNTKLPYFASCKNARSWRREFASGIGGKTVVIVGTGNMGGAGAKRCKALGMRVIGVSASGQPGAHFDEVYTADKLHEVLPQADFLLVALPLTDRTRHLIGSKEMDLLRPDCGLINIGRAGVIDYSVLFEKLRRHEISGAILDVFDKEPIPEDDPVWDVPNLIITPHVSSDDVDRYAIDTVELFFSNYLQYVNGRALRNQVDPLRQY